MSRWDGRSEASFQRAVVEYAAIMGWSCWWTPDSRGCPPGELDLRMVRPPRLVIAELKSDDGVLTDEQRRTISMLKRCPGVEVHAWWPCDWPTIERILKR